MKPQGAPAQAPPSHELRDASVPWIFGFILFLAIAGICMHFGISAMLRHLQKKPSPSDSWHQTQAPADPASTRPVLPRLQVSPPAELEAFRAREDAELDTIGWINQSNRIVHIPITQAMDLLLQKGLPIVSNPVGPSSLQLQQQRPLHTAPEIQTLP